jgi:hypothetical protein
MLVLYTHDAPTTWERRKSYKHKKTKPERKKKKTNDPMNPMMTNFPVELQEVINEKMRLQDILTRCRTSKKLLTFCNEDKNFRREVLRPRLVSLVQPEPNLASATEFYRLCSSPILQDMCLNEEPMESFWRSLWYNPPGGEDEEVSDADMGRDFIRWLLQDKRRMSIFSSVLEQPSLRLRPEIRSFTSPDFLYSHDLPELLGEELAAAKEEVQLTDFLSRPNVRDAIDQWLLQTVSERQ